MNLQWIFVPFYCGILEMSLKFEIRSAKLEFCCFSFALGVRINQYECSICPVWSSYTPTNRRKKTRKNYFKFIFLYMKINSKLQIIASLVCVTLKITVILLSLASSWSISFFIEECLVFSWHLCYAESLTKSLQRHSWGLCFPSFANFSKGKRELARIAASC